MITFSKYFLVQTKILTIDEFSFFGNMPKKPIGKLKRMNICLVANKVKEISIIS